MSTEESVRTEIVDAIRAISTVELGFDNAPGNVFAYLIDHEQPEYYADYLMANCDAGERLVRAWGVQVLGFDSWFATTDVLTRVYDVTVRAYYSVETGGAGVKRLITHHRKVRQALADLTSDLGGTVDYIEGSSVAFTAPSIVSGFDEDFGNFLIADLSFRGTKASPDW